MSWRYREGKPGGWGGVRPPCSGTPNSAREYPTCVKALDAARYARGSAKSASPLASAMKLQCWNTAGGRSKSTPKREDQVQQKPRHLHLENCNEIWSKRKYRTVELEPKWPQPESTFQSIRQPTLQPKHSAGRIVTATSLRFVLSNNSKLRTEYRPTPP